MKTPFDVLKKTIGFLLLAVMLCLSACGAPADQVEDSTPPEQTKEDTPPSSEPADAGAEDTPGKVTYSTQGVSFEVSEDWLQAEGMDMFYTDKNEVYELNGVSPLGSEKLRHFFRQDTIPPKNKQDQRLLHFNAYFSAPCAEIYFRTIGQQNLTVLCCCPNLHRKNRCSSGGRRASPADILNGKRRLCDIRGFLLSLGGYIV